jgi:bacillithiol system protein YtxJ
MDWKALESEEQLNQLEDESGVHPVLIFKHSTRCSISSTALNRIRQAGHGDLGADTVVYVLDLLAHRDISNMIASRYGIWHESPQAILLLHGKPVFNASHLSIIPSEIRQAAQAV